MVGHSWNDLIFCIELSHPQQISSKQKMLKKIKISAHFWFSMKDFGSYCDVSESLTSSSSKLQSRARKNESGWARGKDASPGQVMMDEPNCNLSSISKCCSIAKKEMEGEGGMGGVQGFGGERVRREILMAFIHLKLHRLIVFSLLTIQTHTYIFNYILIYYA